MRRTRTAPPKERSCEGKQSYDGWWEATAAAARQRFYSGHGNIHAYKCDYCNHHHIGHSGSTIVKSGPRRCYVCHRAIERSKWQAHLDFHDRVGGRK